MRYINEVLQFTNGIDSHDKILCNLLDGLFQTEFSLVASVKNSQTLISGVAGIPGAVITRK